jgi:hypothetical protein
MQVCSGEIDLIPFEINRLRDPGAMASHYEEEGCVTPAVAAFASSSDQSRNLGFSEVPASMSCLRHG